MVLLVIYFVVTSNFSRSLIFVLLLFWSIDELENLIYIKNNENRFDQYSKKTAMAAILKIYFELILLNRKTNWLETW